MLTKGEIDMILGILNSILLVIQTINPKSANNPVILEIQNVIKNLQALGI